jgi:hypothetical protein
MELHMANEIIYHLDTAQEARLLTTEECELRQDLKLRVLGLTEMERASILNGLA